MWLNLSGIRIPIYTEISDKTTGNIEPILIRESDLMSIKVARGSVELAFRLDTFKI